MGYDRTTDPERAAARWRAKRDMSPSEFAEWEAGVMRSNRGEAGPMGPSKSKLPGMSDRDEFATALGRDLGYESSKYKGAPVYEDPNGDGKPVRRGERGPGIYTPEGGAFSGAGLKFDTDRKVAEFDTPQEMLRKKFEPRLSKMSADEKEMEYRKARGMEIPRGLQARREVAGLNEEIDAYEQAFKGLPGMGGGGSSSPAPKAEGFSNARTSPLNSRGSLLERTAGEAPAVAQSMQSIMEDGPKMAGASALMPTENAGGNAGGLGGSLRERILAQKFGIKYEDPAERARKDEERSWMREDREAKKRQMELDTKLKEFQVNQAMMTTEEKAAEALKILKMQNEMANLQKTPAQKLKDEMEFEALQRERTGALSPLQEKEYIAKASTTAKDRAAKLAETMPWEEAAKVALDEQNAALSVLGVKTLLNPSFLAAAKPAVDTRPAALMAALVKGGKVATPDDAIREAVKQIYTKQSQDGDAGMRGAGALFDSKLSGWDFLPMYGTSRRIKRAFSEPEANEMLKNQDWLTSNKAKLAEALMGMGLAPEQAQAVLQAQAAR